MSKGVLQIKIPKPAQTEVKKIEVKEAEKARKAPEKAAA